MPEGHFLGILFRYYHRNSETDFHRLRSFMCRKGAECVQNAVKFTGKIFIRFGPYAVGVKNARSIDADKQPNTVFRTAGIG